ncbi:MAG: LLM class F420-dependent oxidoreductase [Proteobacteria bacterium]|nr:MAG: LLM class F420-dependent oxidoreductase [Pseudomonadota bacterium]
MDDVLRIEPAIRCGVVLTGGDGAATRRNAQRIEALGFDSLWVGDHVAFHVPIPDSLTMLAFAAAVTERVALGTAVYLLPLRPPALIAKTTATLDLLSGGRLVLGVGVGGEFPPEFAAVGVPVAERGARADEAIEVVRRLWTEDRVAHEGRHFRFGPVTIAPKPARVPPIWVGGRADAAMRRAGRAGDGYLSHMCAADKYRENLELIAKTARESGRRDVAFTPAAFLFTFLEERYEVAHEKASALLGTIYARDFREASKKYCLLGRPADCLEQMRAFARAGCRHFVLVPLSDPAAFAERAAAEILPELRASTF